MNYSTAAYINGIILIVTAYRTGVLPERLIKGTKMLTETTQKRTSNDQNNTYNVTKE